MLEKLGIQYFDPNLWFHLQDGFHAKCLYFEICPVNNGGICRMAMPEIPKQLSHKFDGKNGWKCPCG